MPWNLDIVGAKWALLLRRITQAWLLLVVLGSLQPKRPGPMLALHREIHWLAFAGAAFLLLVLSRTLRQAIQRALLVFVLGAALESLQHFLYHTAAEWRDLRDDSFAILGACAVYWVLAKRRSLALKRS